MKFDMLKFVLYLMAAIVIVSTMCAMLELWADSEEENIFQLSPSILASRFGTSYRHVQRVIKQFIDQRIIEKEAFKTYRILERQTLEKLACID